MKNYNDIINLPHHESSKHPRMSIINRAAQFAPFAALTGYEDAVNETARITDKKIEISDELKTILNSKLQILNDNISYKPEITITYFLPDDKKDGGKYIELTGNIRKLNIIDRFIQINDKKILIDDIIGITGEIFKEM